MTAKPDPEGTRAPPPSDEATGLPGFRSWRAVYAAVLVVLAVWIGLLALLTERFA